MSVATVLGSASLSPLQYASVRDAVTTLTNLHFAPADVAAAASGLQNVNSVNNAVGESMGVRSCKKHTG